MAKQQKVKVKIPKAYKPNARRAIAQQIIDFIVNRTGRGRGIDNKPWGGKAGSYSQSYKDSLDFKNAGKTNTVNLELSSDMLNSLELLSSKRGEITLGYAAGDPINDKVEGNRLGTYGQKKPIPGKARDFLGIRKEDLNRILKKFPRGKSQEAVAELENEIQETAERTVSNVEFRDESE